LDDKLNQIDGAGVMKHRLKAEAISAAVNLVAFGGLLNFFSGNLTRKTLLFVVVPLIFLSYFGTLAFAIFRFPEAYDWRNSVISHLISPRNNPEFHSVPSFGMAITGLLMIPFAGYINRRLRVASQLGANIGTFAFGSGVIWLILAGLIVSQRHNGTWTVGSNGTEKAVKLRHSKRRNWPNLLSLPSCHRRPLSHRVPLKCDALV
jgi:hypothetical protein